MYSNLFTNSNCMYQDFDMASWRRQYSLTKGCYRTLGGVSHSIWCVCVCARTVYLCLLSTLSQPHPVLILSRSLFILSIDLCNLSFCKEIQTLRHKVSKKRKDGGRQWLNESKRT